MAALLFSLPLAAAPALREAPNPGAAPVNQLAASGNACGPAALLMALRCGDAHWQRAAAAATGETDRARLLTIIRTWGLRPSGALAGTKRWSRHGVNVEDLRDIANEMTRSQLLPQLKSEVLLLQSGETPTQLLARAHARLSTSLRRGLPPIISIRRIVKRPGKDKSPAWEVLQGHYVTLVGLPAKLERGATAIPVTYLDPWGGRRGTGSLTISQRAFLTGQPGEPAHAPCLEAAFPQAEVGKKLARPGEATLLTLAAVIGQW
ncbi:MAG: hypothetical protein RLZZ522_1002 [Verrucomicrobiota bacterium]